MRILNFWENAVEQRHLVDDLHLNRISMFFITKILPIKFVSILCYRTRGMKDKKNITKFEENVWCVITPSTSRSAPKFNQSVLL